MELQGQDVIVAVALGDRLVKIFTGSDRRRDRRAHPRRDAPADDPALAAEVDHLRGRLAEVEERLDFAERLLAQAREADQLPGRTHR